MEHILEFIKESKKLMNYAMCAKMATGYKTGAIDIANYSRLLIEIEKQLKENEE